MSATAPQCTPAEIALKRRIAEERLKQNKLKRRAEQNNNENRLSLNSEQSKAFNVNKGENSSSAAGLSKQQKDTIEFNRQEAIKRKSVSERAAKEAVLMKISQPASSSLAKSSSTSTYIKPQNTVLSSVQPSVGFSNQVQSTGKSNAPSKTMGSGVRHKPYQRGNQRGSIFDVGKKTICCKVEFVSEVRFEVRFDTYNELIISEFRKIKSKAYNPSTKEWSFDIKDYDSITKLISDVGNDRLAVFIERVPDFAMKLLKEEIPEVTEACLGAMEPVMAKNLFDFQRTAVAFGISKGGRFLLGDDMGLGKTREALAVANFYKSDWPLLIVTTASSRTVWSKEIMSFMPHINVYDIRVLESYNDSIVDAKVVICSYSSMENNMKKLEQKNFGVVIFDESHALKNSHSKQTANATKLGHKATRAILVTGTPALSAPVELFTQLHIIKKNFASYTAFTTRYCDGKPDKYGWKAAGCTNPKELEIIMRKHFMIRRLKSEVFGDLGGKNREKVELAKCSFEDMQDFAGEYKNAAGRKAEQHNILLSWYASTAKQKKNDVCRYIEATLKENTDEKILIFAVHHCILDAISDSLANNCVRFVRIDGKTSSSTRSENVASFQSDPNIRCAVLSILACKEGITLTSANIVIFAELDWTPSNMLQAEGRAHRIGQTRPVKVFYLISPGTADDVIWRKLEEKQRNLSSLGLGAKDECLGENTATTFMPLASSSRATPSKQITDFFASDTPTKISTPSDTLETFHSCETSPQDRNEIMGLTEAQTLKESSKKYLDSQEDFEIDLEALLQVEKEAKAGVSASTSKASSSRGVSKHIDFHTDLKELSEDSQIDLQALMEIEKKATNRRSEEAPSVTQKLIQSELEGIIFDDEEEDELLKYCIVELKS